MNFRKIVHKVGKVKCQQSYDAINPLDHAVSSTSTFSFFALPFFRSWFFLKTKFGCSSSKKINVTSHLLKLFMSLMDYVVDFMLEILCGS